MTNNEIFKTILHLTGLTKEKQLTLEIFSLGGITASNSKVKGWRTDIDINLYINMPDEVLTGFFNGLFEYRDIQTQNGVDVFNFIGDKGND